MKKTFQKVKGKLIKVPKILPVVATAAVPAFAGNFKVADFLCSVYHTIGKDTTGHALITVITLLGAIGVTAYAAITSIKEKKANTLWIVIALVLFVLTTTWGSLIDTISNVIGFQPFIEQAPTGGSTTCNPNS